MKYWTLPDDGAEVKCDDCNKYASMTSMYLVETPDGKRRVLHQDCVDPDWIAEAQNMGEFRE